MLTIKIPDNRFAERSYIINVLLGEFLGLDFEIQSSADNQDTSISFEDKQLVFSDIFFAMNSHLWLKTESLPSQPLKVIDVAALCPQANLAVKSIPVIYGTMLPSNNWLDQQTDSVTCGLDIFGSCFFMLSRYEEYVSPTKDSLNRFPASASLAYQENFLDRPIVNEYLEILWALLKKSFLGIQRKQQNFSIRVSHDVDRPYKYYFASLSSLARGIGKQLLREKSLVGALKEPFSYFSIKYLKQDDPFYNFDWIMKISEKAGLKSTFYFLAGGTAGAIDGDYQINHPRIVNLLKDIDQREHLIGLHGSYNSYNDQQQYQLEFQNLLTTCRQHNITQPINGSRQHYLRWSMQETPQVLCQSGVSYDTTLTFAEHIGFRCGTCYAYPLFDITNSKVLPLIEQPLLVMEASMLGENYMSLNYQEAVKQALSLKQQCRHYHGDFTLLWHNSSLVDATERQLYQDILLG